jgi:hypothetical protein
MDLEHCAELGLVCYRQEIVNWGCNSLTDSFTYIARKAQPLTAGARSSKTRGSWMKRSASARLEGGRCLSGRNVRSALPAHHGVDPDRGEG